MCEMLLKKWRIATPEVLGQRLAYARANAGLTQEEAMVQSGIPASELSRIEHGTKNVYALDLARLAEVYRVPIASLLEAEEAREGGVYAQLTRGDC